MRLTSLELGVIAVIILYIAFYTHPPPAHISDFLSSPIGKIVGLLGILYVTAYKNTLVGIFLAIAYLMTVGPFTEYLDEKEQKPKKKEEKPQPKSEGVPPPAVTGALASMLEKGDMRLPAVSQKKGTPSPKPATSSKPKPSASDKIEHFASF